MSDALVRLPQIEPSHTVPTWIIGAVTGGVGMVALVLWARPSRTRRAAEKPALRPREHGLLHEIARRAIVAGAATIAARIAHEVVAPRLVAMLEARLDRPSG